MSFVLYVGKKKGEPTKLCDGSQICMSILKTIPDDIVSVQNCDVLRKKHTFPEWLRGTPTLFIRESNQVVTGSSAVSTLHRLAAHISENEIETPQTSNTRTVPKQPPQTTDFSETSTVNDDENDEPKHDPWKEDDDMESIRRRAEELESRPKVSQREIDDYMNSRR